MSCDVCGHDYAHYNIKKNRRPLRLEEKDDEETRLAKIAQYTKSKFLTTPPARIANPAQNNNTSNSGASGRQNASGQSQQFSLTHRGGSSAAGPSSYQAGISSSSGTPAGSDPSNKREMELQIANPTSSHHRLPRSSCESSNGKKSLLFMFHSLMLGLAEMKEY
jgi:hypothetical protein